jgi:uncharacterized protein
MGDVNLSLAIPQFSYTADMDKNSDLKRLQIKAFARDGASLKGLQPLSFFERLSDLALVQSSSEVANTQVQWEINGEALPVIGGEPQIFLHLNASVSLPMQCQRCLGPVKTALVSEQSFRFVPDEATAEAEDDESEEDLLVLTSELDVWELIEDELIMSTPIVPKHAVCPTEVPMSASDESFEAALADRPNPFAALAELKKKPH